MFRAIIKFFIFCLLLFTVNFYLLKPGIWLFQDASGIPKNTTEAYQLFLSPFFLLSSDFYFSYSQGILTYLNLMTTLLNFVLISLLGVNNGQIVLFLFGYIFAFFSFYLFSGLFFKNKNVRYVLSLIFTFNPLVFNLQGSIIIYAAIPLYLYSFHHFFFSSVKRTYSYLLINILAVYLWIAYIRLFQANFFIIIPFLIYFFLKYKKFNVRKFAVLIISYLVIFLPLLYTIFTQLLEKSSTAFNYSTSFINLTERTYLPDAFNIFSSFNLNLYENNAWQIAGLFLYAYFLYFLTTYSRKNYSRLISLNLFILLFGISCFGLGILYGDTAYSFLIKFLPFITNGAYWALYITIIPFLIILGVTTQDKEKSLYLYTACYLGLSILPFIYVDVFQIKQVYLGILLILTMGWVLLIIANKLGSRSSFILAFSLIFIWILLRLFNNNEFQNKINLWTYTLLAIGLSHAVWEEKKQQKLKSN